MRAALSALHARLCSTVLGAEEAAYLLMVALLADGHVLVQGPPGVGKTSLAGALAQGLDSRFSRIQFTPDLLPSDILGYSLYDQGRGQFSFIPGPIFANIVLADEINRTGPRIQSALFECMSEKQVTLDRVTHELEAPFLVIATQNNLYATGTFPLPEPQLDRFLLSIAMRLPDAETQASLLALHASRGPRAAREPALMTGAQVVALQAECAGVPVSDRICRYITALCEGLRLKADGSLSARASIALMRAAQAAAWLEEAKAVHPDHVKRVAAAVLAHRLVSPYGQGGGQYDPEALVLAVLESVPVP